jgi:uncharacterized protein (DUF1697 family)
MNYVALLRGINVGGRNLMAMASLKACLEGAGFTRVETLIQSGNVVFCAARKSTKALATQIEDAIESASGVRPPVLVVSLEQMRQVHADAPAAWKRGNDLRRNIAFLFPPVSAAKAVIEVEGRPGVDEVATGKGVLYLTTPIRYIGRSKLAKIVGKPIYRYLTIRTYATCQKILALMERG